MDFFDKIQFAFFAWAGIMLLLAIGSENTKFLKISGVLGVLGTFVWLLN